LSNRGFELFHWFEREIPTRADTVDDLGQAARVGDVEWGEKIGTNAEGAEKKTARTR